MTFFVIGLIELNLFSYNKHWPITYHCIIFGTNEFYFLKFVYFGKILCFPVAVYGWYYIKQIKRNLSFIIY